MKIAVIPARGGSKRIPRKNIKLFCGKPMIVWSIEAALESGCFDRVIVSTDDEEIASVANSAGAEVPFMRPAELSDDHCGLTSVVAHAVRVVGQGGPELLAVCCILPTAPFLAKDDLRRGLEALETGHWDFVLAATGFPSPIFRSFRLLDTGGLAMYFPEHFGTRSQDLPEAMHDAGQFCWGRPQAWMNETRVFDADSTMVEIPRWRVQDIDTADDWRRAELMYAAMSAAGA